MWCPLPVHVHLNPVGGIAGDMFISAILDAWPSHGAGLHNAIRQAGLAPSIDVRVEPHGDGVLTGTRFSVTGVQYTREHTHFGRLRDDLAQSALEPAVRERAIEIFTLLARAEAGVHGVPTEEVSFHEVGAEDSVADVVGAAYLIETLQADWSCDPLPMGSGRVSTHHGDLPVPVPAVAHLLEGFPMFQDAYEGERITPTGAAILKCLAPSFEPLHRPLVLRQTGVGFGTRRFSGISNILRALVFEEADHPVHYEQVGVLSFEIDDQTPEDLGLGLDRLREHEAVLEVTQLPALGKKGRLITQVQVLTRPHALHEVARVCMSETATLGVRCRLSDRLILDRGFSEHQRSGDSIAVKTAHRPDGTRTAKGESADLANIGGYAQRQRARREAEAEVLARDDNED